MHSAEGISAIFQRKRNDTVRGVVADVGAATKRDARAPAPLLDDRRFRSPPKSGSFGRYVGDAPEPNSAQLWMAGARGDVEHQTIDPIQMLANIPRSAARHQVNGARAGVPEPIGENRTGRMPSPARRAPVEGGCWVAPDEPVGSAVETAASRTPEPHPAACGTQATARAGLVKSRIKEACVAITQVYVSSTAAGRSTGTSLGDPVRAVIPAPSVPHQPRPPDRP